MADPISIHNALADTWHLNNRVNLRLLDALGKASAPKLVARSAGFAVRITFLRPAITP